MAPRRPPGALCWLFALQLLPVAAYLPPRAHKSSLRAATLDKFRLRAATLDLVALPPPRLISKVEEGIVRTARSWITEQCFRGWLRDTKKKGVIEFDAFQTLEVVEPDECDIDESFQRCPDVVRLGAQGVTWLGFKKTGRAKLQATSIAMELVNMHRRVLTRGRRGSFRAQLTMTGRDLDASAWIKGRLDKVVRKVLTSYMGKEVDDEELQFRTTIERDGRVVVRGAARVVQSTSVQLPFFYYAKPQPGTAPFRFSCSFRLSCEGGAVLFKEPDVYLPDRPSFEAPPPWLWQTNPGLATGLAGAPTSLVEFGSSLFLSSVTVDPTASFAITALEPSSTESNAVQVTVEAGPSLAPKLLPPSAATLKQRLLRKKFPVVPPPVVRPAYNLGLAAPQTTFVVGENLPWVLNANNAAPFVVFASMLGLSVLFQLFALPDACFRIVAQVPDAFMAVEWVSLVTLPFRFLASVEWVSLVTLPAKGVASLWKGVTLAPKLCSTIVQAIGANAIASAPRRYGVWVRRRLARTFRRSTSPGAAV